MSEFVSEFVSPFLNSAFSLAILPGSGNVEDAMERFIICERGSAKISAPSLIKNTR